MIRWDCIFWCRIWVVAVWPLLRPLRLCGERLVIPGLLIRPFVVTLAEIELVHVGRFRWSSGRSNYNGFAMLLHTSSGPRLVSQSLYCGRRRLEVWANLIASSPHYTGRVEITESSEHWRSAHRWPVW